jgi:hypothetical protein
MTTQPSATWKGGDASHVVYLLLQLTLLTRDSEVLYASASVLKAVLCAVPVELSPFDSILLFLCRLVSHEIEAESMKMYSQLL